jgi:dTDP-4-amino-4,6-dideoxygalactose transaminase
MSGEPSADPRGTNGKSNELSCAVGLLVLDRLATEIAGRARAVARYREELADLERLSFPCPREHTTNNHAYVVVRLATERGRSLASEVDRRLRAGGIESRRYFAGPYSLAATPGQAPRADAARNEVLCLPLWGSIPDGTIDRVCRQLRAAVSGGTGAR